MLRITPVHENGTVARYHVEGRITQHTVGELSTVCEAGLEDHVPLVLNLSGVQFIDTPGLNTLRGLTQRGVALIGCSGFLTAMLQVDAPNAQAIPESSSTDERGNEAQILSELRAGKADTLEKFVRQYGGRMLATARRLLKNEHDAQDAVQEAFLSALKALDQFTGSAKLSTWLHRIVVNAALMKLRSRRRRPEDAIEDLLPHFDAHGEWVGRVATWETSSEVLLQRHETRAVVRRCIDQLPETYRTVLLLRDIEGRDTEEVAALLAITTNAVKIRLHRARQALRTLLERELAGEPSLLQAC